MSKNFSLRIENFCRMFFGFIFDPIIFLSMLGPLFIGSGLQFMGASLAEHSQASSSGIAHISGLFGQKGLQGLVDYVIQYYTLTAAGILWVARCFRCNLLADYFSLIRRDGKDTGNHGFHHALTGRLWVSGLFFFGLVFAIGALILSHKFSSPWLLEAYINHSLRPVETTGQAIMKFLPPFDSPITWCRGLLAIHLAYLIKPFESPKVEVVAMPVTKTE